MKSLRDARQILRSSPMQKGVNSKEHGSLRVASMGAALRACTTHVNALSSGYPLRMKVSIAAGHLLPASKRGI
ncbi:hypothetical protein [Roseateles oligotrophus]|uniref:Uncharacterized protein n=1 Tax=Roseateles oligotrophus TaxID=1769250 RepID=A0ABT2YMU7_9BURK|nr:hypothetical protein [Roseateles oligotrophus]MCV2371383.1 hypothetical protein [Roseateles oligotrophus]